MSAAIEVEEHGIFLAEFAKIPIGASFVYLRPTNNKKDTKPAKLLPIYCKKVDKEKARPLTRYVKSDVSKWTGDEGDVRYRGLPEHMFAVDPATLVLPICEKLKDVDLIALPRKK